MTLGIFILLNAVCCAIAALYLRNSAWRKFIPLLLLIALTVPYFLYFFTADGSIAKEQYDEWQSVFVHTAAIVGFSLGFMLRMTFWLLARYKIFRSKMKQ